MWAPGPVPPATRSQLLLLAVGVLVCAPPAERARLPLLLRDGELIAAADLWIDASVRARGAVRRRARLIWHKAPHGPC